MKILKAVWEWLVYSTADPSKLALTLKAGVPLLVTLFAWHGIPSESTQPLAEQFVADSANALVMAVQAFLGLLAAWGAVRKAFYGLVAIWNLILGEAGKSGS